MVLKFIAALPLLLPVAHATAQEFNDPYSIMAPERGVAHHGAESSVRRHVSRQSGRPAGKHQARRRTIIAHGSSGLVLPTPLPRTQLISPEGGGAPLVRPAPQQQGATVLPGANPIPNLPHGPETFQDRASRCPFQQQLYNVPGNLGTQYMGTCVQ